MSGEYTRKGVQEVGGALDEAYEQGKKAGEKIYKEASAVKEAYDDMREAQRQADDAEKEARVMQRAAEIKRQHPNVPAGKAIDHARNEEDAGMLRD